MNRRAESLRATFRLDFALRGHAAYTQPLPLEQLIELVEDARSQLGAPLLATINAKHVSDSKFVLRPLEAAAGIVIDCRTRFAIRKEAV